MKDMKIAVQVPMKFRPSTRVPNKNFRNLCGKPLNQWLLDQLVACPKEWDIFIDSENERVMNKIGNRYETRPLRFHQRLDWFSGDHTNGNHLINQFALAHPNYDVYIQSYITAVTLNSEIIKKSVEAFLSKLDQYDSMFLVSKEHGWIWYQSTAVNYDPGRPDGLPRSQDAVYFKETTGLYAITREAVFRTGCRIGNKPLQYEVDSYYAMDIDTMEDLKKAENILSKMS